MALKEIPVKYRLASPFIIMGAFVLDRMAKNYAMLHFASSPVSFDGLIRLVYIENTGISFGLFQDMNRFFIVFTAILIGAIVIFRRKIAEGDPAVFLSLSLVLGGALGNLYDRIAHGYVVDFIDLRFFPAVFNTADFFITVAAAVIVLASLRDARRKRRKECVR